MSQAKVPAWVSVGLIPLLNILLAFLVSVRLWENNIESVLAENCRCTEK